MSDEAARRERWARAVEAVEGHPRARTRARHQSDAGSPLSLPAAAALTAGGLVALGSLWLPWYDASRADITADLPRDGWSWLGAIDVLLVATAIAALALVSLGALAGSTATARLARPLQALGALALFTVCFRIGAPPDPPADGVVLEVGLQAGPCIAATGVVALLIGARAAQN